MIIQNPYLKTSCIRLFQDDNWLCRFSDSTSYLPTTMRRHMAAARIGCRNSIGTNKLVPTYSTFASSTRWRWRCRRHTQHWHAQGGLVRKELFRLTLSSSLPLVTQSIHLRSSKYDVIAVIKALNNFTIPSRTLL